MDTKGVWLGENMKEKLIYTINRKKYLLVETPVTELSNPKKIEKEAEKLNAIFQGVKEIKRGWFSGYAILKFLIPFDKLEEYRKFKK